MPQTTTEKATDVHSSTIDNLKRIVESFGITWDDLKRHIILEYEREQLKNFPFLSVPPESGQVNITYDRSFVLDSAKSCVCKDRQNQYGPPEDSFATIAAMWEAYLKVPVRAHDVAAMMILLKVARIKNAPFKIDNWVDGAGYAACGGEIATQQKG